MTLKVRSANPAIEECVLPGAARLVGTPRGPDRPRGVWRRVLDAHPGKGSSWSGPVHACILPSPGICRGHLERGHSRAPQIPRRSGCGVLWPPLARPCLQPCGGDRHAPVVLSGLELKPRRFGPRRRERNCADPRRHRRARSRRSPRASASARSQGLQVLQFRPRFLPFRAQAPAGNRRRPPANSHRSCRAFSIKYP